MDLAEVWEGLGDARMRLGDYERGGEAFRASRDAYDGGAVEDARLMQKEAVALLRLTRYADALERLTAALDLSTAAGRRGDAAARKPHELVRGRAAAAEAARGGDRVVRAHDRGSRTRGAHVTRSRRRTSCSTGRMSR